MFTGLIQSLGNLTRLDTSHLKIECHAETRDRILQDMEIGDSIAVDGVCLTVETGLPNGFIATASPETLARSTLGELAENAVVNLESSLRVGSKIGGHFVTGHVDGFGTLEAVTDTETSWELRFRVPSPQVARYIVPKGSIAVNGISLTVADCSASGDWFMIAVIPVTYAETNLHYLRLNQSVNLEGDVLGKYAEKFLNLGPSSIMQPEISLEFLTEHGYT
ncbi:riboflavin synthase [Oscillatoria sp. CS-180]|uniref:riboflavin synthase n=1 Tax=Oscillatoria sp. CS-180 TaxID=3021720 RepID=UPI00232B0A23|nr:riboflavin synthase [Oscillatoria sp. CS-180]MDB9527705.1 riboflavin synthase [Oscillatoria sp. CS-180]